MEGPCPDKFAFAERSGAMKAPVGLLSDRTVLHSKMEGPCPDKFAFAQRSGAKKERQILRFGVQYLVHLQGLEPWAH